jgi:hypothetical protein
MQLLFAEGAVWQWHRRAAGPKSPWIPIPTATSRSYTPAAPDAGHFLRAECTPWHGSASGVGQAAISPEVGPVRLPPNPGSGEGRHELTAQRTASPTVRFVSYNLLADQYAATDTARDVLFNYCPPEYVFQSINVVNIRNVVQSS